MISLESIPSGHSIALPLVDKNEESARLPLVINVVAKYWGEDLYPLAAESGPVGSRGSVLIHGIELAESKGFVSFIYRGTVKDIKKRIDQGIPPIVILPGIRNIVQHALIVSGFSDDEKRIMTYVPEPDAFGAIPESKFENDWRQDEMTTIIIAPSDMKDLFNSESLQFSTSNRLCFEAEALRQNSNMEGGIAKLRLATEIDQDNAQAWCLLGGALNELGDKQTISCYEKAISLNPMYYLAYRGLGNYYLKRNEYKEAESAYTNAILVNPARFAPTYKNRAITRMQLGDMHGAKSDLVTYLEQLPDAEDRKSIEQAISEL